MRVQEQAQLGRSSAKVLLEFRSSQLFTHRQFAHGFLDVGRRQAGVS
jgi:hypothetical protein